MRRQVARATWTPHATRTYVKMSLWVITSTKYLCQVPVEWTFQIDSEYIKFNMCLISAVAPNSVGLQVFGVGPVFRRPLRIKSLTVNDFFFSLSVFGVPVF